MTWCNYATFLFFVRLTRPFDFVKIKIGTPCPGTPCPGTSCPGAPGPGSTVPGTPGRGTLFLVVVLLVVACVPGRVSV